MTNIVDSNIDNNTTSPLVSIIVPVYNGERFMSDCLSYINNQVYKNIEVIFINDCSIDNTLTKLRELEKKNVLAMTVISNPQNRGTGYSRNVGMTVAKGDYVFFMDQDDEITSDCISTLVEDAINYGLPDIVVGGGEFGEYPINILSKKYYNNNESVRHSYFTHEWYEMPWNKLIRRDFLLNNKLFFVEGIFYEDSPWSFSTALQASTIFLEPKITYIFKHPITQKTATKDLEKITEEKLKCYEAMFDIAHKAQRNKGALLYVMGLVDTYLLLVMQQVLSISIKKDAYRRIRALHNINDIKLAYSSATFPRGIKALLLYRLIPNWIGFYYTCVFQKLCKYR